MPAWTDATDREMFLNIITILAPSVSKANCDAVADMMTEKGFTGEAVRQRLKKVRKQVADAAGTSNTASGDASTSANGDDAAPKTPAKAKKTPQKKAAGEGKTKAATPASKRKAKAAEDNEDDDEASPSKKMKAIKDEEIDMD